MECVRMPVETARWIFMRPQLLTRTCLKRYWLLRKHPFMSDRKRIGDRQKSILSSPSSLAARDLTRGLGEWMNSKWTFGISGLKTVARRIIDTYFHVGVGTSQSPSSDIYTGPRPFSETVTHNVAKYLYRRRHELKGYIDFHAYSQLWMSPWGYTKAYPPKYDKMVC